MNPLRWPAQAKVIMLVVVVCWAVIVHLCVLFHHAREMSRQSTCKSSIEMTVGALQQYARDWDDRLPPAQLFAAAQHQYAFPKYDRSEPCPSDGPRQETSYAMPGVWSGKKLSELERRPGIILVYEADHGVPAYRHAKGMNVGYAAERTRWRARDTLSPEDVLRGIDPNPAALPKLSLIHI